MTTYYYKEELIKKERYLSKAEDRKLIEKYILYSLQGFLLNYLSQQSISGNTFASGNWRVISSI